ncbi:MAG: type I-E CRISPR-associated protein Cse1/CasA [Magnetococcales bacterium]|nr:type I-E CRISPR-associated protein Cse1/CasA [Magnetococcales bacterium]
MNLIENRWLPVVRADGSRERICPAELTSRMEDNPVVALDLPRPDFHGAAIQWLIGLLQSVLPPEDEEAWRAWLDTPPTPERLATLLAPVADCFSLDGEGPRFMQDFDQNMAQVPVHIGALLIDAPGEQTVKDGKDLFQKRGSVNGLCPSCSGLALFTLQTNAPSGGAGHRTSLRGGGPLSTLVMPDPRSSPSLWGLLWWNVLDRDAFMGRWGHQPDEMKRAFCWLSPTRTSEQEQKITPEDAHPAMVYWAMPRRIRLEWAGRLPGICDLCGQKTERLTTRYYTRPYGMNATDWEHPLTPHYQDSKQGWLPVHPQPGGIGYRHWLGWVVAKENTRVARVVQAARQRNRRLRMPLLVWAFGYDMDNMKARCWYEARMPLITLEEPGRTLLAGLAEHLVGGATLVKGGLSGALRNAWFETRPGQKIKGDYSSSIAQSFWEGTEADFYRLLWRFADLCQGSDLDKLAGEKAAIQQEWHGRLCQVALHLFDQWATRGALEFENPGRIARAYHLLRKQLYGAPLRKSLGLPVDEDLISKQKGKKK